MSKTLAFLVATDKEKQRALSVGVSIIGKVIHVYSYSLKKLIYQALSRHQLAGENFKN